MLFLVAAVKSRVWSYGSGRNDRARSVAHIYDQEVAMNSIRDNKSKSNLYASRNSVSRIYDDNEDHLASKPTNRHNLGKYIDNLSDNETSLPYKKNNRTPDLRSDIDKRITLASEHSTAPSAEQDLEWKKKKKLKNFKKIIWILFFFKLQYDKKNAQVHTIYWNWLNCISIF